MRNSAADAPTQGPDRIPGAVHIRARGVLPLAALLAVAAVVALAPSAGAAPPRIQPRPGDAISVAGGGSCTLGFILKASDGAAYASTVGHCVLDTTLGVDQRDTWPASAGPAVSVIQNADGSGGPTGPLGHVVYAEFTRAGDSDFYDFAVIRLGSRVDANPAVRQLGGPRGLDQDLTDAPTALYFYGQAEILSSLQSSRQLVANTLHNTDHVYANGPAGPGDSGAPVLDSDGRAVGLILGAGGNDVALDGDATVYIGHDEALNRIGRLSPLLRRASQALHTTLKLRRT
jgi:hypothetical protein